MAISPLTVIPYFIRNLELYVPIHFSTHVLDEVGDSDFVFSLSDLLFPGCRRRCYFLLLILFRFLSGLSTAFVAHFKILLPDKVYG